jgi:hypothetical protein
VESGRSNVVSMWFFEGVMGGFGELARCDDEDDKVASDALIDASRSRAVFELSSALSASKGCRFRAFNEKLISVWLDIVKHITEVSCE